MEASVAEGEQTERRSVDQLKERLAQVELRQKEIDTEFADQSLPKESKIEFEDLQGEKKQLAKLIEELEVRAQWIGETAQPSRESGAEFYTRTQRARGDDIYDLSTVRGAENPTAELRDRARTAVERMQFPQLGGDWRNDVNREDCQGHIEALIAKHDSDDDSPGIVSRRVLATSSALYRKAFWKSCASQPVSSEEQRALSLTGASGGFAIPTTLDPTIIPTSNSAVNPTRAISRVETITGNIWNGVSSGAITASRVAEATAATDNAPTLVQPTATVSKAHAFVPFSHEVGEDWGALESEMGRLFQDAKDDEESTSFVTGAGSATVPQGFVTGTTNTVAAATGLTVTAANLYALEAALPPRFRPNETIVANRGIYNVVRGIDTAGGAALWLYVSQGLNSQVPTPGNTGALLLGRPAYEATAMQATVVNATKIAVIGDFSYFLIVDRIGMQVEVIPNLFGASQGNLPTGQRGLYAYWRNYSKVLSAAAFVALTGTT